MKEPDSYQRRARHIEQLRIFLLSCGLDAPSVDHFFCGMISEGGATWDDAAKILTVDYPHVPDFPVYRMQFKPDGSARMLGPEEGPEVAT